MATLKQNEIIFALNADVVAPFSGKYTNVQNFNNDTGLYNDNQNKLNNLGVFKSVNAVEIDWKGAKLGMGEGTNGITSTGELMKDVYSPMFAKAA